MAINLLVTPPGGLTATMTVLDGGVVPVPAGSSVQVELLDDFGRPGTILDVALLACEVLADDLVVDAGGGHRITLQGFAEAVADEAVNHELAVDRGRSSDGSPLAAAASADDLLAEAIRPQPAVADRVAIDYLGGSDFGLDGDAVSRVSLYVHPEEVADLDRLLEALEVHLGLAEEGRFSPVALGAPAVAPLDLSDLFDGGAAPLPATIGEGAILGLPATIDLATLWSREEPAAVNDNSVLINP